MSLKSKIIGSFGKKAAKAVAKKAVKVLSEEKNIEKATKFIRACWQTQTHVNRGSFSA